MIIQPNLDTEKGKMIRTRILLLVMPRGRSRPKMWMHVMRRCRTGLSGIYNRIILLRSNRTCLTRRLTWALLPAIRLPSQMGWLALRHRSR